MNRCFASLPVALLILLGAACPQSANAASVSVCDEASLRAAVAQGGNIQFGCDGTIVLTNTLAITNDVTLDANGHNVTLSGGDAVRHFTIQSNASLSLIGLRLVNGLAANTGGAVLNQGSLTASGCVFSANTVNPNLPILGQFSPAGHAEGGAIWNSGQVTLRQCILAGNRALGAQRVGAALWAQGGAILNQGTLLASETTFSSNLSKGSDVSPDSIGPGGPGVPNPGGTASGGALDSRGTSVILNSTFENNSSNGGYGSNGSSQPGFTRNGGSGGQATGAGIFNAGNLVMTNCTSHGNTATGGRGGAAAFGGSPGSNGQGLGGGLAHNGGTATLAFCTLAANTATNGGAIYRTTNSILLTHTILAHLSPNNNCSGGSVTDGGHNISSDSSCGFTDVSSQNNSDPLLGPLADNGGPTLTMALLPGSPAINAGSETDCPATDQRGVARPAHGRCDIGAFEVALNIFTLATCDDASLRAAIAQGGEIQFNCDGTIVLTNTLIITEDVTLDANGHSVTLSGANGVRLFSVNSSVTLTLLGLALANGRAEAGAGIMNHGGAVYLANCTVANHSALGTASVPGVGGFLLNRTGTVSAVNCTFSNNVARGGKGGVIPGFGGMCGTPAAGGVIANELGQVHLTNCVFIANSAVGGDGGDFTFGFGGCGAPASGGVISSVGGIVEVFGSRFQGNLAAGGSTGAGGTGGNGGVGGAAMGGAIAANDADLLILGSAFARNEAVGGTGGRTQPGGTAKGGAITCESGESKVAQCSLTGNRAAAGFGRQDTGVSASAFGGAFFNTGSATVEGVTFATNSAWGAFASGRPNAGAAGNGEGGGLHNAGSIQISASTLAGNSATGGGGTIKEGSMFPPIFVASGNGSGGAIHNGGSLSATNLTLANNRAEAGTPATFPLNGQTGPAGSALGGGIYNTSSALLADSIIAYSLGPNCSGPTGDVGFNLSSDSSCNFTAAGSQNNSDPKLAPLADNGGPTLTMALLPGSPAVNAGSEANCGGTDQRGVARPAYGRCDIGAYELVLDTFRLTSVTKEATGARLRGFGPPGGEFAIKGSSQLVQWDHLTDSSVQNDGTFNLLVPTDETCHFFRVAPPGSSGGGSQ